MLQFASLSNVYKSISIVDGSSGLEKKPYQVGGGIDIINTLHGQESKTWLASSGAVPSDVTTAADYGDILGKTFKTLEAVNDAGDTNVNPFLAAARFLIDRGNFYSGLRFAMDRFGTGGTKDISGQKALVITMHQMNLQNSVKLQTKESLGYGLVLESGSGFTDYVAHTVSGSDASTPKVTPLDPAVFIKS